MLPYWALGHNARITKKDEPALKNEPFVHRGGSNAGGHRLALLPDLAQRLVRLDSVQWRTTMVLQYRPARQRPQGTARKHHLCAMCGT